LTNWLTAKTPTVSSELPFAITDNVIESFANFCRVDLLRSPKTVKEYVNYLKRHVKEMGNLISATKIRTFLSIVGNKYPNPGTHRAYLCMIKVFCRDFLGRGEWVATLKFPKIKVNVITDLPDRKQLTAFFKALPHDTAKAVLVDCIRARFSALR
jgi:hypothetical protein